MLPIFKDLKLQEQFEREGFVKLKLFAPEQIAKLRDYYEEVKQEHEAAMQDHSLYSSVETGNADLLMKLDHIVKETTKEQVESIFQNYQTLISNYLIKDHGEKTELMPHQDLSFVNEPNECSFNLWIPLQKTDKSSGQLRVLKGSHLIRETLRVVPQYPRPFVGFQDIIRELFTDIETEVGDCVVINHAVIHGSTTNLTGKPRVAVILAMCSAPADIYYYYMPNEDNNSIEKYKMKAEDYYYFKPDGRPEKGILVDTISYPFEHASEQIFKHWIKNEPNLDLLTKIKLLFFKKLKTTNV
jgi:ectoine hydroxylase-related dioxygenase (phytanoyl-CoA dioxygenase family)